MGCYLLGGLSWGLSRDCGCCPEFSEITYPGLILVLSRDTRRSRNSDAIIFTLDKESNMIFQMHER